MMMMIVIMVLKTDDDEMRMMMLKLMMMTPMWVLAGLTSHLVKWLLRWLGQIKVCLSTVPFDRRDHDDDAESEMVIMME